MGNGVVAFYTNPTPESGVFDVGVQALHKYEGAATYAGFSIAYFNDLERQFYYLQSDGSWSIDNTYANLKLVSGTVGASGSAYLSNITENAERIKVDYYGNDEEIDSYSDEYILKSDFSYGYNGNIGILSVNNSPNNYYVYNPFGN